MKVALCGAWHVHAEGYFDRAAVLGEIAGVWDADPERCREFAEKKGVKAFASFEELLESDAQGVIVATATDLHTELIVRLAEAGKHIFTEKVLALSDEDCDRIARAVEENHVNFVISLPQKYVGSRMAVQKIAASGELGKLNYLRFRNCHSGSVDNWLPSHFYDLKQCGGGAMIDLGAHGMYLTDWICGAPDSYRSVFTLANENERNRDRVEDNAVTVMGYENGCIAINETGFVSKGCPAMLEVGGDRGYVRMDDRGIVKSTATTGYEAVAVEPEPDLPSPIDQFLTGRILPGCGIAEAVRLTHMMVMAYQNQ